MAYDVCTARFEQAEQWLQRLAEPPEVPTETDAYIDAQVQLNLLPVLFWRGRIGRARRLLPVSTTMFTRSRSGRSQTISVNHSSTIWTSTILVIASVAKQSFRPCDGQTEVASSLCSSQ